MRPRTLLIIVTLSLVLVVLTIVIPAFRSVRRVSPGLIGLGTAYFVLIGLGFMLVEIGLIQRLSVFLGHPVYGVAIGLIAIILSTGVGSVVSDRLLVTRSRHVVQWCGVLAAYLALLPFTLPPIVASFEVYSILIRAIAAVLLIAPLGFLLGFGFPIGMRLVNAIDPRPTPWFWAVNGSAGVLAAGIAVAVNIAFSINVSIWLGAACCVLIGTGVAQCVVGKMHNRARASWPAEPAPCRGTPRATRYPPRPGSRQAARNPGLAHRRWRARSGRNHGGSLASIASVSAATARR